MATSDALRVVEDWISEHYFTTDAPKESFHARVLARRKDWDTRSPRSAPGSAPPGTCSNSSWPSCTTNTPPTRI